MMSRGFPNLFVMPAPGQQAVVTVNYTQLAVLGAEFVGRAVGLLEDRGAGVFDVSDEAEQAWTQKIVDSFIDGSAVMSACTPSRINMEGHPELMNPRNGNYGRGLGDYFGYRRLLEEWLDAGDCEGLEIDVPFAAP
jgi:cyclohexanone monooxygenase/pentalenolactone D synthase